MSQAKAKTKKPEALMEQCPACRGSEFSISTGEDARRYCQSKNCNQVWLPQTKDQIKLNKAKTNLNQIRDIIKECLHIIDMYEIKEHVTTEKDFKHLLRENLTRARAID